MPLKDEARYVLPDIDPKDIKYTPGIIPQNCKEDILGVVEAWRTRHNMHRATIATILEAVIQRLEKDAHAERRAKKAAKKAKTS